MESALGPTRAAVPSPATVPFIRYCAGRSASSIIHPPAYALHLIPIAFSAQDLGNELQSSRHAHRCAPFSSRSPKSTSGPRSGGKSTHLEMWQFINRAAGIWQPIPRTASPVVLTAPSSTMFKIYSTTKASSTPYTITITTPPTHSHSPALIIQANMTLTTAQAKRSSSALSRSCGSRASRGRRCGPSWPAPWLGLS